MLGGGCVYNCGRDNPALVSMMVGGSPRCALRTNTSENIVLTPVSQLPILPRSGTFQRATRAELQTLNPELFAQYQTEETRAKEEVAIFDRKLGEARKVRDAFQRLQDAENARDQAPDAYQKARVDYYTLVNGPSWVNGETQRIARSEVDPVVQRYRNEYVSLNTQLSNQVKAYDTMVGIKDKVFRVKDDLTYSADLLVGQVDKVRAQIALERRAREAGELDPAWLVWTDFALNIAIVVSLLVAIYLIVRKLMQPAEDDDPEGELGDALTKLFQSARPPAFTEGAPKA